LKNIVEGQWRQNKYKRGHRTVQSKNGKTDPARSAGKFFVVPPTFLALKAQLVGERFRDGQYSLVSFLFAVLLLTVPPVPSHL